MLMEIRRVFKPRKLALNVSSSNLKRSKNDAIDLLEHESHKDHEITIEHTISKPTCFCF